MTPKPQTRPLIPLILALPLAAAGGVIYDMSFPELAIWPLAFAAIPILLLTLIGRSVWGGIAVSGVFGLAFYLLHVEWASRYLGPIPWIALAGLEAALLAVVSTLIVLGYRWVPQVVGGAFGRLVVLPAVVGGAWMSRELVLGGFPYTGFPWARVAMTQVDGPFAHVASWVGVNGLGFLMVFVCAALIELVRTWRTLESRRWTRVLPAALVTLVMLVPAFPTSVTGTLRVGSVQPNGPSGYFDYRQGGELIEAALAASDPILEDDLDVLLWPEGLDTDPRNSRSSGAVMRELSTRADAPVIMNAASDFDGLYYNTSMLWTADGIQDSHAKRNPVPFGERVPDRWFYEMIVPDLIGLIQREYTPGTDAPLFDVNGVPVGLAICFDVIYDDVIWEGANGGAEVFMFQTNNADFRGTDENLQQLAFARMRAIETGRTVVNISTVGTSQVMNANGTTIDQLPAAQAGAMVTDVELRSGMTPGVVLGPVLQWLMLWGSAIVVFLFGIAVAIRRRDLGA